MISEICKTQTDHDRRIQVVEKTCKKIDNCERILSLWESDRAKSLSVNINATNQMMTPITHMPQARLNLVAHPKSTQSYEQSHTGSIPLNSKKRGLTEIETEDNDQQNNNASTLHTRHKKSDSPYLEEFENNKKSSLFTYARNLRSENSMQAPQAGSLQMNQQHKDQHYDYQQQQLQFQKFLKNQQQHQHLQQNQDISGKDTNEFEYVDDDDEESDDNSVASPNSNKKNNKNDAEYVPKIKKNYGSTVGNSVMNRRSSGAGSANNGPVNTINNNTQSKQDQKNGRKLEKKKNND